MLSWPSQDEVTVRLDAGESFVAVTSGTGCGACKPWLERIETLAGAHPALRVAVLHDFEDDWMEARVGHVVGWPSTVYFEGGRPVDVMVGGREAADFLAFVARNEDPAAHTRVVPDESDLATLRRQLRLGALGPNTDLSGLALDGLELHRTDLSGADLRGTDFSGAILDRVGFSRADLTGAKLDGAQLAEVFWGASTCPDGTPSADHGYTCEGHLQAETAAHDSSSLRERRRACHERREAEVASLADEAERERAQMKAMVVCSFLERTGIELADSWEPASLDDVPAGMLRALGASSASDLEQRGCVVERILAVPGQRDSIGGFAAGWCDGDPAPFLFRLEDEAAAE